MGFLSGSYPKNIITPSSGNEERGSKFRRMAGTILNAISSGGGGEGIIDKFDFDPRDPRSKGHRDRAESRIDQQIKDTAEGKGNYKMTKEEAMSQYDEAMRGYDSPPPRRATRSEMRERRRNPLGMGQVSKDRRPRRSRDKMRDPNAK